MIKIKSTFIANFKVGDNINYNLRCLKSLVAAWEAAEDDERIYFNKSITLLIGAIVEACLYDFFYRIRKFTSEGVPRLTEKQFKALRSSKKDEFSFLVDLAETHELFAPKGSEIYSALRQLVDLRNRIHIQNKYGILERDEIDVYSDERTRNAAKTLERVMRGLQRFYPRPPGKDHVADFELPWKAKVQT